MTPWHIVRILLLSIVVLAAGCTDSGGSLDAEKRLGMCGGDPERSGVMNTSGTHGANAILWYQTNHIGFTYCILAYGENLYFINQYGQLFAINRFNGKRKWMSGRYEGHKHEIGWGVEVIVKSSISSNAVIGDGTLYFGTKNGDLNAVNAQTGSVLWQYSTRRFWKSWWSETVVTPSLTMKGDFLFFGDSRGYLYALNVDSRKRKWKIKLDAPLRLPPAIDRDTLYYTSGNGTLSAVTASKGKEKWRISTRGPLHASPVVANGKVLFRAGDGSLVAVNAETGQMEWNLPVRSSKRSAPAVANGTVYFGDEKGSLFLLDVRFGVEKKRFAGGGGITGAPVVADGIVYFVSRDIHRYDDHTSSLYALNAESGNLMWKFGTAGSVIATPAVSDGLVVVGDSSGTLYALGERPTRSFPYEQTGEERSFDYRLLNRRARIR